MDRLPDNGLRIMIPGREPITSSLERAYLLYEGTPSELDLIVRNSASSLDASEVIPTAETLLVIVRPRAYVTSRAGEPAQLTRPLAGDMAAIVALDLPDSYAMPAAAKLREALKLDDGAIWARALANTKARIPFPPRELAKGRIAEIQSGKGLASSLLLDDAFWDSPELTRNGPIVVAPFARDDLLVALLSDTESVARLRKLMADVRDDPNGLTNDVIVRRNGQWEVLR